jgi:hypothetical protein
VPWLGGFFQMTNPHAMYEFAQAKSPQQRPVRLRVGPVGIYLLFGAKNVRMIFRNSKVLSKDSSSLMIFHAAGMSKSDAAVLAHDKSGVSAVPWTDTPEEKRIWKKSHDLGTAHLANGPSVTVLTTRFVREFIELLDEQPNGRQIAVPLFDFLKNVMLQASGTSLVGSEIFRLNPDIIKTYWDYDEAFLLTAIGLPKFLYTKGYAARDRMLEASRKWIKSAWKNFDSRDDNSDWEKNFGSRYIRSQAQALASVGIGEDGQASAMLPIIWA